MKIRPKPEVLRRLVLPYSEVCMHMKVAGTEMWGLLVHPQMVQLYTLDCQVFSFPITRGEAGWDMQPTLRQLESMAQEDQG